MNSQLLAVLLAVLGYSVLNLTQALQKIGIHVRERHSLRGTVIWSAATVAASVSVLLVYAAISVGSVAVVGALAGTGLVALAVFSAVVMGEKLRVRDGIAISAIVGGALFVGLFGSSEGGEANVPLLYILLASGIVVGVVGWIVTGKGSYRAVVIGGFAGFLGSYAQLFQNLTTQGTDLSDGLVPLVVTAVTNPITAIWVSLSLSSVVVMQFAYKHGDAIQIIPVFTSLFILTPVLGGIAVFGERLSLLQAIGVLIILGGALVLSRRGEAVQST